METAEFSNITVCNISDDQLKSAHGCPAMFNIYQIRNAGVQGMAVYNHWTVEYWTLSKIRIMAEFRCLFVPEWLFVPAVTRRTHTSTGYSSGTQ